VEPVIILEINAFANLCGHFYNAEYHDPLLPNCNNGYNCDHPHQDEGTEAGERFIGSCYAWSCPLGYPPDGHDLKKYGVIGEDEDVGDEENSDFDYIVVTDPETVKKLRQMGVNGLATRTMEEAEAWESERGDTDGIRP